MPNLKIYEWPERRIWEWGNVNGPETDHYYPLPSLLCFFFLFRNNMHSLAFTWSDNTMLIKNWFLFSRSQWAIERASISEGFRECCTMFVGCTAGRLAAARVTARSQQMWAAAAAWARHLRLANPINNHHPRSIRWHCVCAELEGKLFKCHLIVWLSLDTTNKHRKFNKQTNKLL